MNDCKATQIRPNTRTTDAGPWPGRLIKVHSREQVRTIFLRWAILLVSVVCSFAVGGEKAATSRDTGVAVGAQYDTTHVYLALGDFNAFVDSFVATFGGKASKRTVGNVLSVPASAELQYVSTPAGGLSVFAFQTPVPFPFGEERTGYLVTDMDQAIKSARAAGAEVIVEPFENPIGIDAVIQW